MSGFENHSWVPVVATSHFPFENLPYGVFTYRDSPAQIGVAIGDHILNLSELTRSGIALQLTPVILAALQQPTLNNFMALPPKAWQLVRETVQKLLSVGTPDLRDNHALRDRVMIQQKDATMLLPAHIGDYTDFYSSKNHAVNVGTMFRGADNALNPNWLCMPIGYHGRASSVVVSGTDIRRPSGQTMNNAEGAPEFGPSRQLDFELEIAFFVGGGNDQGEPIPMAKAEDHIFGVVLMNDWSARDIQKWEYVPLGPFNGKNFGTTISPWVVPMAALRDFMVPGEVQVPAPLAYLVDPNQLALDLKLQVELQPSGQATKPVIISQSNARHLYWTFKQQLVHHTSTGCNSRPGDLMASGTISGPSPGSYGSMLEICWKGERPLNVGDGTTRTFLNDGDTITITGVCRSDTRPFQIGFGTCSGKVLPSTISGDVPMVSNS
uniref:Fumarylacetoacetase n=2 Tax=Spongospora subterranea TaxID=70186 RepID=A0A0H5RJU9_9EUKA|eukprot:CRZ08989.1 hypothetical protein [Spongospora subterranea]